jgi:DNA polymerase III subunit gamma/tau
MALYNKYRPKTLDEACGQEYIKQVLKNQIDKDDLVHAYLFLGPAGTGKTTIARIFAAMINSSKGPTSKLDPSDPMASAVLAGKNHPDVKELDAASNNGVDEIRELRQNAAYAPMEMRKKIYIIDECHQLSSQAWQALLKILEEPPEWVMFILCTTEAAKIPATIMTRVMELRFNPLPTQMVGDQIKRICQAENIQIDEDAARLVATSAGGSMRMALTNLEKLKHSGRITSDTVVEVIGIAGRSYVRDFVNAVVSQKFIDAFASSSQLIGRGVKADKFISEVASYCHDILVCNVPGYDMTQLGYTPSEVADIRATRKALEDSKVDFREMIPRWIAKLQAHHEVTVFNMQPQFQVNVVFIEMYNMFRAYKNAVKK